MANTYKTVIETIEVVPSQNGLDRVIKFICFWVIVISEDRLRYNVRRCIELSEPDNTNFIDLNNIDENLLISWVESHPDWMPQSQIDFIEAKFAIERTKDISKRYYFPFSKNSELFGDWIY